MIPATFEQDQFTTNVDHQLTAANRLSGKFFFSNQPSRDPLANATALTRFERQDTTYQRTGSVTDVHVFGGSVLNEFRGGFFRNRNDSDPVPYFTNAEFGIQSPLDAKVPDLTQLDIRGDRDVGGRIRFGTAADGTRIYDLQTTYTVGDTVTLTRGRHSIRMGGELRRHHLDGDLREGQNRRHNFRSWFDFLTVGYRDPADGNRARQISDSSITFGETVRNYRMTDSSAFVADDWRVGANLTVNAGLRWDYFGFPSEANGMLAVFDFPSALQTGLVQDGFIFASNFDPNSVGAAGLNLKMADSTTIIPGDYDNIMPRVGFAWTPLDRQALVVRGGYGMFYERTTGSFANSLRQAAPFFRELQLNNLGDYNVLPRDYPPFPIPAMSVGFDDGEPILLRGSILGLDEDEGANTLTSTGKSWYHGLQTSVQKRFSAGYMFNVNYTFSKATDYFSDEGLFQIENHQTHPELNDGPSDFDRRHRLILSWAWELPFTGNRFVEGWQIAGIGTLQSGRPFTITDGEFSAVLVSTTNPRPDLAPGATLDDQTTSGSVTSRLDNYLNRDAFVSSGTSFGTLPRNSVVGPDQRRLDLSVSKMTPVMNGQSLEFRIEAYNVTNTPTFRNPARDISAANFGQITRTRGGPRVIQLGVKFRF